MFEIVNAFNQIEISRFEKTVQFNYCLVLHNEKHLITNKLSQFTFLKIHLSL